MRWEIRNIIKTSICLTMIGLFGMTDVLFAQQENKIRLNNNWKFLKGDLGGIWEAVRPVKPGNPESLPLWENITLPHCFNATDAVDPDLNYYQGPGWYTTQIEVKNPFAEGRTVLHFEGSGQKTDVYVYLTKVGSHTGGYNEWSVDITEAVSDFLRNKTLAAFFKGKVPVSIRCDNSRDLEMIPSNLSDFNVYGGIYRYLNLVYLPAFSIDRLFVNASVDSKGLEGKFELSLKLKNKSGSAKAQINIEILDSKGKLLSSSDKDIDSFEGEKIIYANSVKKPQIWSPSQPNLYTGIVTISTESGIQTVTEKFGFRNFEFVDYGPFKLNGNRLLLRGTHRHEDHAGVGAAMTEEMIRTEMIMMKEMGVNFIRLGHYQQSGIVLELCDSLGLLVWEEIPWCRGGLGGESYKEQARTMLTDMIEQHRNHPSVILWGLGNENDWPGDFPEFDKEKIRSFMSELNALSHKLDPTRMTAIRRCDFCKDIVDVYSPSIWAGWYRGIYTEYRSSSENEMKGVKHFLHAEWGGDSHAGRHSETPDKVLQQIKTGGGADERNGDASLFGGAARVSKDGDWSESYICNLIDWHLKEQENMPLLTGTAYWPFKDFSTPIRPENPVPYMNQKGVVERDFTKKEAYYVFQSWWSEKPMVHIYGHSWPVRWGDEGEEKMVKVYSNCEEAELFVNGKSYGTKKRNGQDFPAAGLRWNVVYAPGENILKVIARKGKITVNDEIIQSYQIEKWEAPAKLVVRKTTQKENIATLEVQLVDARNVLCLDARNLVTFGLAGDGQLLDNLGTSSGSRKVELYNGRAVISMRITGTVNIATVKCTGIPSVTCNLSQ
jgi:beta-galactosidase